MVERRADRRQRADVTNDLLAIAEAQSASSVTREATKRAATNPAEMSWPALPEVCVCVRLGVTPSPTCKAVPLYRRASYASVKRSCEESA